HGSPPLPPQPPAMAPRTPLLLLALLLLAGATRGQHWSHGWYPGGKRDLGAPPGPAGREKLPGLSLLGCFAPKNYPPMGLFPFG
uniref:Progonadoliberin n=1 Tax=Anas platyrhynchos TaxID=8839 RepID=A0A8B9SLB8_ANAPL